MVEKIASIIAIPFLSNNTKKKSSERNWKGNIKKTRSSIFDQVFEETLENSQNERSNTVSNTAPNEPKGEYPFRHIDFRV